MGGSDDEADAEGDGRSYERVTRNAKKIRIERIVHLKRRDEEYRQMAAQIALQQRDDGLGGSGGVGDAMGETELSKTEVKLDAVPSQPWNDATESSDPESALSDEDDPCYLQLDHVDDNEKHKVRIM